MVLNVTLTVTFFVVMSHTADIFLLYKALTLRLPPEDCPLPSGNATFVLEVRRAVQCAHFQCCILMYRTHYCNCIGGARVAENRWLCLGSMVSLSRCD